MPLGPRDELHHTIVTYQELLKIRWLEEGASQILLWKLLERCKWAVEWDSISRVSDQEVTSLSLLIQKLVDQLASWISSTQDATPSGQPDTDAAR